MLRIQSLFGFFMLAALAWLFSENRKKVNLKTVLCGLALQLITALLLLKLPFSQTIFLWLNNFVSALQDSTVAGTSFVFGYLGGGQLPFSETNPGNSYILAFQSLPLVLVISALSALLFYWKVLPVIVKIFSWILTKTMGIGGVEGLGVSANIFVGMVESPLFIRPYIQGVTRSELFTIMASGMATIAGTVLVLYASILNSIIPGIVGHLLTASIISAPAAITVSKLMVPESGNPTWGNIKLPLQAKNSMDAITNGTIEGVKLLVNIIAMLVVLVALIHLLNILLSFIPTAGGNPITFQHILGLVIAPVTWLMGIPWSEAMSTGSLMGIKTVLNELIAYQELAALPEDMLNDRTRIIITYAMCGFANFGSLGIMIGGLGAMAPERKMEITSLGMRSIVAGTLATCMTGAVVGIII